MQNPFPKIVLLQFTHLATPLGVVTRQQHTAYAFDAYGSISLHVPAMSSQMFNGERLDSTLGGYLLGNGKRGYNPNLRRFVSSDQLSPFGVGGLNSYAYCTNEPVNHHDPSGQWSLRTAPAGTKPKTIIPTGHKGAPLTTTRHDQYARTMCFIGPELERLVDESDNIKEKYGYLLPLSLQSRAFMNAKKRLMLIRTQIESLDQRWTKAAALQKSRDQGRTYPILPKKTSVLPKQLIR